MSVALACAEVIEIAGADAIAFAHAQFTSDVAGLEPGTWQFSAWLSAQGRARAVFALLRPDANRLLAWLPLGGAAAIRDALGRFVLRSKVQLVMHADWMLSAVDAAAIEPAAVIERQGGFAFAQPGARFAWIGPGASISSEREALNAWRLADIAAGLPWLAPALQDEFVPQAISLERIDAIRFDKGCYPGQEIAARLHFRGGSKRNLRRLRFSSRSNVVPGTQVLDGEASAGNVLYSARISDRECEALAVLADSSVASSRLTVDGETVDTTTLAETPQ
jgi:tRNA-modifying protein YgfZ